MAPSANENAALHTDERLRYIATMTIDELTAAIDAMIIAAGSNADQLPGLITINSNDWCDHFNEIEHATRNLEEGIRHRKIRVSVSSSFENKVLTQAEAGERGAPYLDMTPALPTS